MVHLHSYPKEEKHIKSVELEDFSNLGISLQNYEINKYWINSLIEKEYKLQSFILFAFIFCLYTVYFLLRYFMINDEVDYFREIKIFAALILVLYARQTDFECNKLQKINKQTNIRLPNLSTTNIKNSCSILFNILFTCFYNYYYFRF